MKARNLMIVIAMAALGLAACAPASLTTAEEARTVSVNGTGVVTLSPDMATINIGVQTSDKDAEKAIAENNSRVQAVFSTLAEYGIQAEDIKTSNFSVYPRNDYDKDGQITGTTFVVNNTVSLKVRDLDILGDLLSEVLKSGANTINGINFDIADKEAAYKLAIDAAVENARGRALALVEAAGAGLGEIKSISTNIYGGGAVVFERAMMDTMMAEESVPVSPGEMNITVDVSVVYIID